MEQMELQQKIELLKFDEMELLAKKAASDFITFTGNTNDPVTVALSGGRITKLFFNQLVTQLEQQSTKIDTIDFFWADERCVPENDTASNFKDAHDLLFIPLNIKQEKIHRIEGEKGAMQAAQDMNDKTKNQSLFDLVILGMGEDGHTASLFPNRDMETDNSTEKYIPIFESPKPPQERVSLSFSAIKNAKNVWVLISGAGKETAMKESLSDQGTTPLAKVIHSREKTRILTDILN